MIDNPLDTYPRLKEAVAVAARFLEDVIEVNDYPLPEIDATSASVLYAFLVNPAIGAGTFLAQWLLRHPLSKIFSYEYDITGSWGEPQVKRHERSKPETPEDKTG